MTRSLKSRRFTDGDPIPSDKAIEIAQMDDLTEPARNPGHEEVRLGPSDDDDLSGLFDDDDVLPDTCARCGDTACIDESRGKSMGVKGRDNLFRTQEIHDEMRANLRIPQEFTHSVYGSFPGRLEFVQVCFGDKLATILTMPHCERCLVGQLAGHTVWAVNHRYTYIGRAGTKDKKLSVGIQFVVPKNQWLHVDVDDSGSKFTVRFSPMDPASTS